MAESTFGRRSVNDGKFVSRLRFGGGVTTTTVERVRSFISERQPKDARAAPPRPAARSPALASTRPGAAAAGETAVEHFRFYDNRQKYLMFVNTCSEKQVIAQRVAAEFEHLRPRPPALRLFDAGVGDGTVLSRVLRSMHRRFPRHPLYVVGKEISLEDVRLALSHIPDRLFEHPATVVVMTNLPYAEAPWLSPADPALAARTVWKEVALRGETSGEFEDQIIDLQDFLSENWRATVSKKSGNPLPEKPVVLVIYREDCRFALDQVIPRRGVPKAGFDLVIASQPYRARATSEFKARRVVAPLARALRPGGRLLGIHSYGGDPGLEIVRRVWPGEEPFITRRQQLLAATRRELGKAAHNYNFISGSDAKSLFRYEMHTLPGEIDAESSSIGTSTLLAAWNAATYVAQIEDPRLDAAMVDNRYLAATRQVLKAHGGLWFFDESYVIARKREP
jgi:SAM-dependent methyltransferase